MSAKFFKSTHEQHNKAVVNLSNVNFISQFVRQKKEYNRPYEIDFYFGGNYEDPGVTWTYSTEEEMEEELNKIYLKPYVLDN